MDLAYTIWTINPAATYIPTTDGAAIAQWLGPGAQPTQAQLDAAWSTAQAQLAAAQQLATYAAQHRTQLDGLRASLTGSATQIAGDIAAVAAVVTALEAGTAPTPAQLVLTIRFILRVLALRS